MECTAMKRCDVRHNVAYCNVTNIMKCSSDVMQQNAFSIKQRIPAKCYAVLHNVVQRNAMPCHLVEFNAK